MAQTTSTLRAAYVSPLSDGWMVDEVIDVLDRHGERAALRSCRAVSTAFHARSSHRLFSTTVVMAGRQLPVLAALLSQPLGVRTLGFFIQVLVIGKLGRRQAHGVAIPVEVDPKVLAVVRSKLPRQTSLKFEINAVAWTPPFCFPPSPDLSPSRLLLLSPLNATSATGDNTGLITGDTLLSLPEGTSWALAGGINNAVANRVRSVTVKTVSFVREGDLESIAGHLPRRDGVACYGGSLRAWEAFAGFLLPLSTDLKVIAISWTSPKIMFGCIEMASSLIPAVSACTAIQSLVLTLFIGSSAAASLEEQWRAISMLIAAARNTALRRVLLFFVHCGEPALDEDVVRFGTLQWTSLTQELARCRCLEVVEFQIVGFEAGIAGDIEGKVRRGLSSIRGNEWAPGNEKRIVLRASREPPLVAFEG